MIIAPWFGLVERFTMSLLYYKGVVAIDLLRHGAQV